MAVCRDLRIRAAEIGDQEALVRENKRRARWEWENALRRCNFVGFIGEVLKGVVEMKLQEGGEKRFEEWVEEAKKTTKKRLIEKRERGTGGEEVLE